MPNYNYQVPSAKYRRRLPYVMTAHEQQSDVRARRKSVCPKFEVEVELEVELEMGMEMEMGHSWNKRGYRLQHQDKRKKTPRAERPVCSVSKNYPKQTIPPKKPSTQRFSQTHKRRRTVKKTVMTTATVVSSPSHPHSIPRPIHSKSALLQPSRIRHKQHLNLQSKASYSCYKPLESSCLLRAATYNTRSDS